MSGHQQEQTTTVAERLMEQLERQIAEGQQSFDRAEARQRVAALYRENTEAMAYLGPKIADALQVRSKREMTTTISSRKRQVNIHWLEHLYSLPSDTQHDPQKTISRVTEPYQELINELEELHFFKLLPSIEGKVERTGESPELLKDLNRLTVVYAEPLNNYSKDGDGMAVLVQDVARMVENMNKIDCYLIDYKLKINPNHYSDLILRFAYKMPSGQLKIIEAQINTQKAIDAKKEETPIYDFRKDMCSKLCKMLDMNLEVVEVDMEMRKLLDANVVDKQGNILNKAAFDLAFIKRFELEAPLDLENVAIISVFEILPKYAKAFAYSYKIFASTSPSLFSDSDMETLKGELKEIMYNQG